MSYGLHQELIPSSRGMKAINGKFIPTSVVKSNFKENGLDCDQILIHYTSRFEIYEVFYPKSVTELNSDLLLNYSLRYLMEYKVFGEIKSVERAKFSEHKFDTIILLMDQAKISFLEYDPHYNDFRIICLYNLENDSLNNGKKFMDISFNISLLYSKTSRCVVISSNLNYLTILREKSRINQTYEKIDYLDSFQGEDLFEPSIYLNLKEFNVTKILQIFTTMREKELIDFKDEIQPLPEDENSSLVLIVMYLSGNSFEPILNNSKLNHLNIYHNKVNLSIFKIYKTQEKKPENVLSFENLNPFSFSFFFLTGNRVMVVFSPYSITLILIEKKEIVNYVVNQLYTLTGFNPPFQTNEFTFTNLDLDLRGGSYLVINDTSFFYISSLGHTLFCTVGSDSEKKLNISLISFYDYQSSSTITSLGVSFDSILYPTHNIFFMNSKNDDPILVIYHLNKFNIVKRLVNISPITNLNVFIHKGVQKFVLTSGLEKSGKINFLLEKAYFDIAINFPLNEEVEHINSFNYKDELNTRFLLVSLKSGKNLVFENEGRTIVNIETEMKSDMRIISSQQFYCDEFRCNLIIVVKEKKIEIYSDQMKLQYEITLKELFKDIKDVEDFRIKTAKLTNRKIILHDEMNDQIFLIKIMNIFKSQDDGTFSNNIYFLKYETFLLSEHFSTLKNNKILHFDINHNPIQGKNFIVFYYQTHLLEIYDLDNFNRIIETKYISEFPMYIMPNPTEGDFERSISDPTQIINIRKEIPIFIGATSPKDMFFDLLESKVILSFVLMNGIIIIYEFYSNNPIINNDVFKLKKIFHDNWESLDFKAFIYSDHKSIYHRFQTICDYPGVLISVAGKVKAILDINGKIKIVDIENIGLGKNIKLFVQYKFSKEITLNGFCFYENDSINIGSFPKNYKFTNYGLIKRNKTERTPVKCVIMVNYNPQNFLSSAFYLLIERETQYNSINNIKIPKSKYFLILRDEENIYDQIEFSFNEIVLELNFVDLIDFKNRTNDTKFLAVGVTIADERGEESVCSGKLILFNILKGKFVKLLENINCKGTISLIQSIDGFLIVGEGNKLIIYSLNLLQTELVKIAEIDNKNLSVCSKVHSNYIISGDIFESVSLIYSKLEPSILDRVKTEFYVQSKDTNQYKSTAVNAWIDDTENEKKIGCILADSDKNVHIFLFTDENNRQNVMECADIYLGKKITELSDNKAKLYVIYSATDGSIGFFKSVSKEKFKLLQTLSEFIYNHFPFKAGMNPKIFYNSKYLNKKAKNNILEMEVLNIFFNLPPSLQKIISTNVVSSKELILSNITELK